ncbi:hypothetical protein N7519_004624 [Penicillium mononematosum]|uniref:uncharacterized protein n=1 Tax=Penicillium mononematosum TaxID=268346 RepID=UPI0025498351|nr:uncharacterized protein N7519_004624 [Penicillium mononematosum]KAJ6189716.1 hypothetical protein N7519_004624 [Penicillium mononematosum]
MKFLDIVLVAVLVAFANAAAVPNPEAALEINPLEKRCKGIAHRLQVGWYDIVACGAFEPAHRALRERKMEDVQSSSEAT